MIPTLLLSVLLTPLISLVSAQDGSWYECPPGYSEVSHDYPSAWWKLPYSRMETITNQICPETARFIAVNLYNTIDPVGYYVMADVDYVPRSWPTYNWYPATKSDNNTLLIDRWSWDQPQEDIIDGDNSTTTTTTTTTSPVQRKRTPPNTSLSKRALDLPASDVTGSMLANLFRKTQRYIWNDYNVFNRSNIIVIEQSSLLLGVFIGQRLEERMVVQTVFEEAIASVVNMAREELPRAMVWQVCQHPVYDNFALVVRNDGNFTALLEMMQKANEAECLMGDEDEGGRVEVDGYETYLLPYDLVGLGPQ